MTTCRDIITTALRKVGAISRGREPKEHEAKSALEALQSMYLEWVEGGMFGRLAPATATMDADAAENQRILVGAYTISLPLTVTDACSGDARSPLDMAPVMLITAGEDPELSLFDAYRGEWVSLTGLDLSDEAPLANRGTDGLACCLAKRLVEEYGPALGAQSEAAAARFMSRLANRRTSDDSEGHWF